MSYLMLAYSIIPDNWTAIPKMRIHHETHYQNTKTKFRKYILPMAHVRMTLLGTKPWESRWMKTPLP